MRGAERLYYDAQEVMEFTAEVTDIRLESQEGGKNRWQVALDRTAFYPEGGGQPWDLGRFEAVSRGGARLEVPVLGVVEEAGEIWHVVEKPVGVGTRVTGHVDAERRRDHMQQHTGQHLLSAVFLEELGVATVSFHLGGASSTIDLAVATLGRVELARVEEAANQLIREDRLIKVVSVDRAGAEAMLERGALRKLPQRKGTIRVVEIDGVEWSACGGTHMASTGRIGGLTLRGSERVKAGVRVEFCCGLRAVRAARRDFEALGEMGAMLSTGAAELVEKVRGMLEEARAGAKVRRAMLEEMAAMEARVLVGNPGLVKVVARDLEYGKLLAGRIAALDRIALVSVMDVEHEIAVLAAGSACKVDCGVVMKAVLSLVGGRGGGSPMMAQGSFEAKQAQRFAAEVRARLAG